jgi:hypothetical protein
MILVLSGNERIGQPGEKRQGRDRVDRREERRKSLLILINRADMVKYAMAF